jgi:hypothetical protein
MARGSFKADPLPIIRGQWATYVDARTHRIRLTDHLIFNGVPAALGGLALWREVKFSPTTAGALLAATGLLGALLFGVMLQIVDRAVNWADTLPGPSGATTDHARYLRELAANAGYSSLICIAAAASSFAVIVTTGWTLRVFSAVTTALVAHLVLVLLMVMKRVFLLVMERLDAATTQTNDGGKVLPHRPRKRVGGR